MHISELIRQLQQAQDTYGDVLVYVGGSDYPEPAEFVTLQETDDDGYIPEGCLSIN